MADIKKNILLLPGDGIGPEIIDQAKKVLDEIKSNNLFDFSLETGYIGGAAYDKYKDPFPSDTIENAKKADGILLGAVGGPEYDALPRDVRPEVGLLKIRKEFDFFANYRPALVFKELVGASSLKKHLVEELDILILRELTGDIYFGDPKGKKEINGSTAYYDTMIYSEAEISRIAHLGFQEALKRGKKLCSVDKANVLETSVLWRKVVDDISKEYPEVMLNHMYIDNATMQIIREPKQFDVILTGNMFGDILSDAASMLTGSIGMLPSASLNSERKGLYEPVHGSAPDIKNQDIANPLATILSLAMMFRFSFNQNSIAEKIELAVTKTLDQGFRTKDISNEDKFYGTNEIGDRVRDNFKNLIR